MPAENVDREVEGERLRQVRALVEDVLRENDVCGQVILAGRAGRFENFTFVGASWSNVSIEATGDPDVEGIRVRSKAVDYPGNPDRQHQCLAWSVGVVGGFARIGGQVALRWLETSERIDAATGATHTLLERDDPRDQP